MLSLSPGLGSQAVPQVLLEMRKEQSDVLASPYWLGYAVTGKTELNEFLTGDKENSTVFVTIMVHGKAQLRPCAQYPTRG